MNATDTAALEEIERLCRRLRMPYVRRQVHDVVATAKAQRWDPAEVVRVLLDEEARGRDASTIEIRRRKAAFPAGTVTWFSVEQLGGLVARHRIDDSITKALKPVLRSDLVVVDDIGLLPITADAAEGLYRLVDAAYERRSVAISSNLHPSGFDELMPRTIASALVDRLMHHAHVLVTTGDSVRLTDAADGKGVKPLT